MGSHQHVNDIVFILDLDKHVIWHSIFKSITPHGKPGTVNLSNGYLKNTSNVTEIVLS